jgi:hypothetical protein
VLAYFNLVVFSFEPPKINELKKIQMFFYLTRPHTPLSLQQPRLLQGGEDPRVGGRGRTLAGFKKYKTQYSARVYFTQKYKTQYSARVYFTGKYKTKYILMIYWWPITK